MNDSVYIRPIRPEDAALVSYGWRNNPKIWRLTGYRPANHITPEMEKEWLENVLKREDEKRFAICLSSDDRYIGNVFLTHIKDGSACVHVFIGEIDFWGSGKALSAVKQVINYAFTHLDVDRIRAEINQHNIPSISLTKAIGFRQTNIYYHDSYKSNFVAMEYTREMYLEEKMARSYSY